MNEMVWYIGTFRWSREGGLYIQYKNNLSYVPKSDYILLNKRDVE